MVPFSGQKGPVEAKPTQCPGPPASQGVALCKRGRGGASAGLSPPPSPFHKSPLQRRRRSREVYGAGAQRGGTRHLPFPRRFLSFLFSHLGLLNLLLPPRRETAPAAPPRLHLVAPLRSPGCAGTRGSEGGAAPPVLSVARPAGAAVSEPLPPGDGGRPRARAAAGRPLSLPATAAAPRNRERRRRGKFGGLRLPRPAPESRRLEWPEAAWPASPRKRRP